MYVVVCLEIYIYIYIHHKTLDFLTINDFLWKTSLKWRLFQAKYIHKLCSFSSEPDESCWFQRTMSGGQKWNGQVYATLWFWHNCPKLQARVKIVLCLYCWSLCNKCALQYRNFLIWQGKDINGNIYRLRWENYTLLQHEFEFS